MNLPSRFAQRAALYIVATLSLWGCNALIGIEKAHEDSADGGDDDKPSEACEVDIDEDFVRGCIYRLGCDPLEPIFNLSGCLTYKLQGVLPGERATLNAESCRTIEEALGRRYEPNSVCASSDEWSCSADGNVATYCGTDRTPYSADCTVVGSECAVPVSARATAQPCGFPEVTTCGEGETVQTTCDGTQLRGCDQGAPVGFDCAALQLKCFDTSEGAVCAPNGASCDPDTSFACTGDDIRSCSSVGISSIFECHKGTECDDSTPEAIGCYVPGCTPAEPCVERCDGADAHFCIADVAVKRDCTDYGFDKCVESTLSTGVPVARCMMNDGEAPPGTSADWEAPPNPGSGGGDPGTGGGSSDDYCTPLDNPLGCASAELCVASNYSCFFRVNNGDEIPFSCDAEDGGLSILEEACGS